MKAEEEAEEKAEKEAEKVADCGKESERKGKKSRRLFVELVAESRNLLLVVVVMVGQ